MPTLSTPCVFLYTNWGRGLKACPENLFDTFTKWKIDSGKWKVSTLLVIPCSTRNLLMLIKEKPSELTLNQVQGARNHSHLQVRERGEGSSRRGKPCKNFPLSISHLQLQNWILHFVQNDGKKSFFIFNFLFFIRYVSEC